MSQAVNVYIAGDISYVTGTVNGTSYTWTLSGDHIWSTDATASNDGVYVVAITAIDTAGNEINVTTTAYAGLHLIMDRVAGAYYNADDLNRVGAAIEYVAQRLADNGTAVTVSPYTAWTTSHEPNRAQMANYLANVETLKSAYYGTQEIPTTMRLINHEDANNIEKALKQVNDIITQMIASRDYWCGLSFCGVM